MIKPVSLYIGLRYIRAKQRNRFISFISLASILGIALGVTVLITVLSVINGFDYQIRTRFFALQPQVTVFSKQNIQKLWPNLKKNILKMKQVTGVAPFASGKAMLIRDGKVYGLEIMGIDPKIEKQFSKIESKVTEGRMRSLQPGRYNIMIGRDLALRMGVGLGDKISVVTPQLRNTPAGVYPRIRRFTVSAMFHASSGFGFDTAIAYINLRDAQRLFPSPNGIQGVHLRLHDIYQAGTVSRELQSMLPPEFRITNWMLQFGSFFQALAMEKTILFAILILIVAVAVFNLVSTLVMVVNDKRADIAILRTLGASPKTIWATILFMGAIVGVLGTLFGLAGGLLLASNVTSLAEHIQRFFGVQLITSSVYFIDYLPSRIQIGDVISVCFTAFGLSMLATLYPAWLAFRTQPAEALRYE